MSGLNSHFIDGHWFEGDGSHLTSTNPATGATTWEGRAATPAEVREAMDAAKTAFEDWAHRPVSERLQYLEAFGAQVSATREHLAETISRDTGKPRWESLQEVDLMVAKIGLSAKAYEERCRLVQGELAGARAVMRFKPLGVMVVFGPFNMPGHLPNGHIIPALLAGNTVVLKPSRQAPLVAAEMLRLWEQADLPSGVVNMVQGGKETGMALSQHPDAAGLLFTGSWEVGRELHRALAGHPEKMLVLEMGGNNPLVVHDIADLDTASYLTVLAAFITSGQRCTCARRLIVPQGYQGDAFIGGLIRMTKNILVGAYTEFPEPFMGPVISAEAGEKLLTAQDRLVAEGGRSLLEMVALHGNKAMLSPGIVDVTAMLGREDVELFGPLLQVIRVSDFEAALREANRTAYGLSAGLLSDNAERYEQFYRRVRAGVVNWNHQTTGASGKMPFGGVGASGNFRPSGFYAVDYCSYPVASIETEHLRKPNKLLPGIVMP